MSLFDVPEEDRVTVLCTAIISAAILGAFLFENIADIEEKHRAFENGYEQVYDPQARKDLWKKKETNQ